MEEVLKEVKKLAEMKVKSRMVEIDKTEQQDIVQLSLIAVWQSNSKFKGKSNFKGKESSEYSTWVGGIIKNKISEALRQASKAKPLSLSLVISTDDDGKEGTLLDALENGSIKLLRDSVAIGSYPSPEAYEAFSLQSEGWSQKEIAQKRGKTYAAHRKQMSRWMEEIERDAARRMAREEWEDDIAEFDDRMAA
jgi:DNA-directed RNA polymerase specialized sigma24 family protein